MKYQEIVSEIEVVKSILAKEGASSNSLCSAVVDYFIDLYNKGKANPFDLHLAFRLVDAELDSELDESMHRLKKAYGKSLGAERFVSTLKARNPQISPSQIKKAVMDQTLHLYQGGAISKEKAAAFLWVNEIEIQLAWFALSEEASKRKFLIKE